MQLDKLRAEDLPREIEALAELLHHCVHAGASVSFVLPFTMHDARAYWREQVAPGLKAGTRHLIVAHLDGELVGTVQLSLDTPPNQRHRCEVSKLLVHRDARRQGVGNKLLVAAERVAKGEGRSLITLDTKRGDGAETLYRGLGYQIAGIIPRYAKAPDADRLDDTVIMYKELA
ncbi:MAG TPA: GNAT family N-acetyltransferase [Alphaproteobacteria bacterium]|nr:GNAT family N-acetyltransferase [Alphaproteobacteria bacterium]